MVVPTRNRAENVLPLGQRVIVSPTDRLEEIIFVYDSTDATWSPR